MIRRVGNGFTLVEMLIAVVMVGIAVMGLGRFMAGYQKATAKATLLATMTTIAKERIELIRGDPRYNTLATKYGAGAGADTTGFPDYGMIRRVTIVNRDRTGSPPRDRTTVSVQVFTTTGVIQDTVSLTAVIARP